MIVIKFTVRYNIILEAGRYVQNPEHEIIQLAPQRTTFCKYIGLCRPSRNMVHKNAGSYGHFAECLLFKCTN